MFTMAGLFRLPKRRVKGVLFRWQLSLRDNSSAFSGRPSVFVAPLDAALLVAARQVLPPDILTPRAIALCANAVPRHESNPHPGSSFRRCAPVRSWKFHDHGETRP